MENAGYVIAAKRDTFGLFVSIIIFCPSTRISLISADFFTMAFIFKVLSKDALTNSGVISSPFWNFTFSRIWNFHVVGSTFSHLSASYPLNSILSVTVTNVSPAPIRTIVQPSHSCAGSIDSPNQYSPKFKCLAAPEADFSFPPHPVNAAVINRQQRITYRIFFILSSYRMHKKEGHEKGLLTVSCT